MAMFKFVERILADRPIDVFNRGQMKRDFTYVDDVVEAIVRVCDLIPDAVDDVDENSPAAGTGPFRLFNIGNDRPVELMQVIRLLEAELRKPAELNLLPMQPGDVPETWASIEALRQAVGFQPQTTIEEGIQRFVSWYREYFRD
jgi:UDP-glucuronate 4-epimerase